MDLERCPNCRRRRTTSDEQCQFCGWLPLRSTEMAFVDEQIVCPACSSVRSSEDDVCPSCGTEQLLDSPSDNTLNFQISSIFLVTTSVAVCIGITRVVPFLGIASFVMLGLCGYRTVLLIRERKRFRYPVAIGDVLQLMITGFVAILASIIVFIGATFLGGMLLAPFVEMVDRSPIGTVVVLVILIGGSHAVLAIITSRNGNIGACCLGVVVGLIVGSLTTVVVAQSPSRYRDWLMLLPVLTALLSSIYLASSRGNSPKVKPFLVGHSSSISLIGFIAITRLWPLSFAGEFFLALGGTLLPLMAGVMVLEGLWKWDDAFPRAISHDRRDTMAARPMPQKVEIDEDGIEFRESL